MIVRSFNLENSKPVVTPGVKVDHVSEVEDDKLDGDIVEDINSIIAEISPAMKPMSTVKFSSTVEERQVLAYSEVYG